MSRHGMIAEHNTKYSLTIPKELKAKLAALAKEDNRSLNNLIITVLEKYASDK